MDECEAGMPVKRFKVLVVDDVVLMCSFLYSAANQVAGCRAYKAFNYKTAASILENEPIDLVITDIELGHRSGLDLLMDIRTQKFRETRHNIPIIMFSGNAYRNLIETSIKFDANDFLVKPVTYAQLKEKILFHLNSKKRIQTIAHYSDLKRTVNWLNRRPERKARPTMLATVRAVKKQEPVVENILSGVEYKLENLDKLEFLFWPEKVSSGYFQLDRRLKNLVHTFSFFYQACVNNYRPVMKETERRRACSAGEALLHISQRIRRAEGYKTNEFWESYLQRLDELRPLLAELHSIDLRETYNVFTLLTKLASWWVDTCKSPIVNEEDEHSDAETQ